MKGYVWTFVQKMRDFGEGGWWVLICCQFFLNSVCYHDNKKYARSRDVMNSLQCSQCMRGAYVF